MGDRVNLDNAAVADALERYASLLDLSGASPYAVRAYRRAAELIRALPTPVVDLVRAGRVRELRGIGPGLEARLNELVATGEIAHAKELEGEVEPELVGLGRFLGLSPKRAVEVGRALNARTAAELREAVESGRVQDVPGMGPKSVAKLRAALERAAEPRAPRGLLLSVARELADGLASALDGEAAGDPRRWADVSTHFSVVSREPGALERFASLPQIVSIVERGDSRATGVTVEGVPVELVVADPARFGTELLRATGTRAFVESLGPLPDAPDEHALFNALGLPFVPPELREGPYARAPPALVELGQIRGDLHVHTTWSDGRASVLEMGEAARDRGYEYLAICDHTPNVRVVPGLDADAVRRQGEEIAAANEQLAPFRVLRGIECDILPDGTLDLPDDVLAELDWVQASVHAGQRATKDAMTKRVVEALRHPSVSCLSHPTGRIINHRPENALDLERAFEVALEEGKAVEVNGLAPRLDLRDVHVRLALESGVPIVCSTDAHSTRGLAGMQFSVATARRGGATAADVVNTRPLAELPLNGADVRRRSP
jgi:DNA polymerase (family 10)